jgi:hypothetical protein
MGKATYVPCGRGAASQWSSLQVKGLHRQRRRIECSERRARALLVLMSIQPEDVWPFRSSEVHPVRVNGIELLALQ